jgi:hypothetical protein
VAPPPPAGYSGTPLAKKLGLEPGNRLAQEGREAADRHHRRHDPRSRPPARLVDVKVCAVSAVWSGLKLVVRKELR